MEVLANYGAVKNEDLLEAVFEFNSLELVQFDTADVHILFSPETFQLFRLGAMAASIIRNVRAGESASELAVRYNLSESKLRLLVATITKAVKAAPHVSLTTKPTNYDNFIGPELGKLVLMVNNYCNLKCTYCYELNTVFSKKAIDMSQTIAQTTLDKFYSAFRTVHQIMFIGGEPALSEEVIEFACEYAVRCAQKRNVLPPSFSMITNGAKMTEKLFELIRKYEIQATFSLDGPKAVHDLVRIRHDDSGSYDATSANIRRYSSMFKDKLSIEATLTRAHQHAQITASNLVDFFAREFGVKSTHIVPAGLPNNDPLNAYSDTDPYIERELEEAAAKSIDNIFNDMMSEQGTEGSTMGSLDLVGGMLRSLVKREAILNMCPAGTTQLVVDAFGDLYPCWMFAGQDQFKMGNILRDDIFNSQSRKLLDRIHENNKTKNTQCSKCYARHVCHACIGNNDHSTGAIETIDERFCNTVRNSLKTILIKIGEVRQDPAQWNKLQAAVGRGPEQQCKC
jgi:uncharacterized protein